MDFAQLIFFGGIVPHHHLKNSHVWGCPAFITDPKLQQGKKLSRIKSQSRRGIFVGLSLAMFH